MMDKRNFAFGRMNFILLAVGMLVVDIFSTRRIVVAPIVCLLGFVSMIYAVVHKPKDEVQKEVTE